MKVVIDGQDYAVPEKFTYRELKLMKQLTGLRPGDLLDAIANMDGDAAIGLAAIVLSRAGQLRDPNALYDKEVGSIVLDLDEDKDKPAPPRARGGGSRARSPKTKETPSS